MVQSIFFPANLCAPERPFQRILEVDGHTECPDLLTTMPWSCCARSTAWDMGKHVAGGVCIGEWVPRASVRWCWPIAPDTQPL